MFSILQILMQGISRGQKPQNGSIFSSIWNGHSYEFFDISISEIKNLFRFHPQNTFSKDTCAGSRDNRSISFKRPISYDSIFKFHIHCKVISTGTVFFPKSDIKTWKFSFIGWCFTVIGNGFVVHTKNYKGISPRAKKRAYSFCLFESSFGVQVSSIFPSFST